MRIHKRVSRKMFVIAGALLLILISALILIYRMSFLDPWDEEVIELHLEWHDHMGIEHIQSTTEAEQISNLREAFASIQTPEKKLYYNVEARDGGMSYKLTIQTEEESWIYTFNEMIVLGQGNGLQSKHSFWSVEREDYETLIEACLNQTA